MMPAPPSSPTPKHPTVDAAAPSCLNPPVSPCRERRRDGVAARCLLRSRPGIASPARVLSAIDLVLPQNGSQRDHDFLR